MAGLSNHAARPYSDDCCSNGIAALQLTCRPRAGVNDYSPLRAPAGWQG